MTFGRKEIENVISLVNNNPHREKDRHGNPGGLLDFSQLNEEVIVIGDLHGSIENLKAIVDHKDNRERLKKKDLILIILGDGMHNDQVGQMLEMGTSLLVLEETLNLITEFGENVIYIRGNHDTFEPRLAKSAIKQGLEFEKYLLEHRGEEYVECIDAFFESLPLLIIGKGYIITHGGPVRGGATREEIINIADEPNYSHQLIWNRLHEFRGTPSLKEYGDHDIRVMNHRLGVPEDTPFIVGHNPMWSTGIMHGIWKDVIGIKNHYILYCNIGTPGPYISILDGVIESHFAVEKKEEGMYGR